MMNNGQKKKLRFKHPFLLTLKTYSLITIGLLVYSIAWTYIILPSGLVGGGITGISALSHYIFDTFDLSNNFAFGITYLAINSLLLLISARALGLRLGIKTIYAAFVLSFFFIILNNWPSYQILENSLVSAILGGILSGVGIGIVFTQGGSIGGTDIISVIIEKYRRFTPGRIILLADIIIIAASYFIFQNIEIIVYGLIIVAVSSYSVDMLLMGYRQSVQLLIFSRKHEEIAKQIANETGRGVTLVNSKGWYNKEGGYVLIVVVHRHEAFDIYKTIKEIDDEAFISVTNAMGAFGKGFDPVKK